MKSAEAEQKILRDLISKWISLGLEYITGTEGVRAIYVYAASEVPGVTYVGTAFDKDGEIQYPTRARGGGQEAINLSRRVNDLLFEDLKEARRKFEEISAPPPTEYRVYYEIATRKLDVQLSREIIYGGSDYTPGFDGFTLWLGNRAPDPSSKSGHRDSRHARSSMANPWIVTPTNRDCSERKRDSPGSDLEVGLAGLGLRGRGA